MAPEDFLMLLYSQWVPSIFPQAQQNGPTSPKSIHPNRSVTTLGSAFGSRALDARGGRWQPAPSTLRPPFLLAACKVKVSNYLSTCGIHQCAHVCLNVNSLTIM